MESPAKSMRPCLLTRHQRPHGKRQ
uniref:Uncharacterized protein n=1 Tax=Anguilla anguilla TaxID=7936 RepID=A0A0E9UTJ6_ANGAN